MIAGGIGWVAAALLMLEGLTVQAPIAATGQETAPALPLRENRVCDAWLSRTVGKVEKVSMAKRYDRILAALVSACPAIPVQLRRAAASARAAKDPAKRAEILAHAAESVLGSACAVPDPIADARSLAAACPLGADKPMLAESALRDLRAADYAFLKALQQSFFTAGEYDRTAMRLLSDFALSAALAGEKTRLPN